MEDRQLIFLSVPFLLLLLFCLLVFDFCLFCLFRRELEFLS